MKQVLIFGVLGVFFAGGAFSSFAQDRDRSREGESGTRAEREERWERFRGMSREERREQWRERRREREEQETAEEEPRTGLEFRSMLRLDGETQFSIRDNDADRTVWLAVGETRGGITVVSFDEDAAELRIEHDGETKVLSLEQSRVAETRDENAERAQRREQWQQRRAEFQEFRERWRTAAEDSSRLQEIEEHFRETGREMMELRRAMRTAERGSSEQDVLRAEFRDLREEMQLLGEYAAHEVRQNPAFEEQDAEVAERFSRMLAFQRRGR